MRVCMCARSRSQRKRACVRSLPALESSDREAVLCGHCTQAKKQAAEQEALQKKLRSRTCLLL